MSLLYLNHKMVQLLNCISNLKFFNMLLDLVQDDRNIQVSYWGPDNKTHIEVIKIPNGENYLWLTSPKDKKDERSKEFRNWNGKPVYKHMIDFKKEKLNRYRLYEILDSCPDDMKERIFSYNLPELFFIDIENKMQEGKPNPEKPNKPITIIGICCPNDTIMVLSGGYNLSKKEIDSIQKRIDEHFEQVNRHFKFVFRYFESEYDMLVFFFKSLIPKMAMMTGWNFEDYDWRYMFNRCKELGIDPTMASPSRKMTGQLDRPVHVGLVDYLKAYKKWTWNTNENYKLDTIGEKLCGIRKVQHAESLDDMLENDFEKYVYYNAIDCCLVKLIHEKCNAITCGLTTSWLGRIKAMDCFSTTYIPENLLRSSYHNENLVLGVDPTPRKKGDGEKYAGAFVKQPIPGLHKFCTCNDYASLYPSLMRQFNIGPETLVCVLPENDEKLKQEWRDKGYIVCASGAVYKKEDGHLKKIITELYFKRKSYKKTSFKYTQFMYDLKDMLHNSTPFEEIEDYLKKNELYSLLNGEEISRDGIDNIINYCKTQADIYNNYQLGTKVVINGIYGAFGFSGFYFYNKDIAESVTKQGKDAILNAEKLINKWASKVWQLDKKTHNLMGIKIIDKKPINKGVTVYIDTDSIYTSYEEIIRVTDWFDHKVWRLTTIDKTNDQKSFMYVSQGGYPTEEDAKNYFDVESIDTNKFDWHVDTIDPSGREFCLTIDRVFMKKFLKDIHEEYARKNGTPNILDFELEAYNEAGIWLAKKKYIKNTTWTEPNVYYDSCSKIKATGVEIAQTSSSPWVKEQLTNLVKWIFKEENFVFDNFVSEVTKVKKQFMRQNVDVISLNKGMNKYESYVLNDSKEIELQPKAMVTVQGAALHNWILNNDEKYKKKYSILMDSDKLCVVYIKPSQKYTYWKSGSVSVRDYLKHPGEYKLLSNKIEAMGGGDIYPDALIKTYCEVFSYPAGLWPADMTSNFEIDRNRMFNLLVLAPINRIVEAMGYSPIDISMTFETALW